MVQIQLYREVEWSNVLCEDSVMIGMQEYKIV